MGIAEEMGRRQRSISVSEFFEKNRHLLGYDNKAKAMLMIVKEGVDNSLDACEEAGILPEIYVSIKQIETDRFQIVVRDNGPGIVKDQIPKIFGRLLYGSKFHRLHQSRGQQGLGISCAVLYSQLTTGNPTTIVSSTGDGKTHIYQLKIDVAKNKPILIETSDDEDGEPWHGVEARFVAECTYREKGQSVLEYMKQTAISNPYADITFDSPAGRITFKRGVDRLPPDPKEIMPHIQGVELGVLGRMLSSTNARTVLSFLTTEFSRLGKTSAIEILRRSGITREEAGRMVANTKLRPGRVTDEQARSIIEAVKDMKLVRPPTDCLSPLGMDLIRSGLVKELNPEFVASVTRSPEVYRGWPFQIEVGLAFGGSVQQFNLMRFANRVPLLYQGGICAMTRAVNETDWRRYGLQGSRTIEEPLVIFAHLCSVWVPFTSESKEAIANYDIIIREIKLALQECARQLSLWLSGKRKKAMIHKKKSTFERYASETARALSEMTGAPHASIHGRIMQLIRSKWGALQQLAQDEEDETTNGERESGSEGEVAGEDQETGDGDSDPAGEE